MWFGGDLDKSFGHPVVVHGVPAVELSDPVSQALLADSIPDAELTVGKLTLSIPLYNLRPLILGSPHGDTS
jgi:hypothetical protein